MARRVAVPVLAAVVSATIIGADRLRVHYAKTSGDCVYQQHASVLGPLAAGVVALAVTALGLSLARPRRTWEVLVSTATVLVAVAFALAAIHCTPGE